MCVYVFIICVFDLPYAYYVDVYGCVGLCLRRVCVWVLWAVRVRVCVFAPASAKRGREMKWPENKERLFFVHPNFGDDFFQINSEKGEKNHSAQMKQKTLSTS